MAKKYAEEATVKGLVQELVGGGRVYQTEKGDVERVFENPAIPWLLSDELEKESLEEKMRGNYELSDLLHKKAKQLRLKYMTKNPVENFSISLPEGTRTFSIKKAVSQLFQEKGYRDISKNWPRQRESLEFYRDDGIKAEVNFTRRNGRLFISVFEYQTKPAKSA